MNLKISEMNTDNFEIGDKISIGNDNHKLFTTIEGFVKYGEYELVQTEYGEFNISLIKKQPVD